MKQSDLSDEPDQTHPALTYDLTDHDPGDKKVDTKLIVSR